MVSRLTRLASDLGLAPEQTKRGTKRDTQQKPRDNKFQNRDRGDIKRYDIRLKLQEVLDNPKSSPQSKAAAGRTLAEMEGLIGRHQIAPDRTAITPINALSRSELEVELARLRDKCKLSL